MKLYIRFLKWAGFGLTGVPRYISARARMDGTDPSLIVIGDNVVISSDVRILTHDFSVARIDHALGALRGEVVDLSIERNKISSVRIGDNSFVGAFSVLMPGSVIGRDCIIGAGSVVRGTVPDGSVVIGNPGKVVKSIYSLGPGAGAVASPGV
jgi:acetyltransferase-like isoleucine patch superfamily enzyme